MSTFSLTAYRGDTILLLVTVTREGDPVSLDGASMWFTAKTDLALTDGASGVIQKTVGDGITVTDSDGGLALVTIDPSDTNDLSGSVVYQCDVQTEEASGILSTAARGTLTILLDVTRST